MSGWRVDPGGVQRVLDGVDTAAGPIASALNSLPAQLSAGVDGTRSAEAVAAMDAFVQAQSLDLSMIQNRIPSAKQAVTDATNAVTAGDLAMAQSTQAQAASVWNPEPDLPRGPRGTGVR